MTYKKITILLVMFIAVITVSFWVTNLSAQKPESISPKDLKLYTDQSLNPAQADVDTGKKEFDKNCSSCHKQGGKGGDLKGSAATFPKFVKGANKVLSLQGRIQACRKNIKLEKMKMGSVKMAGLVTYVKSLSNGIPVKSQVSTPEEKKSYDLGKYVFEKRRGYRNLSCQACHEQMVDKHLRMQKLSAIGNAATHWPAYRMTKAELTIIENRFRQCMKNAGLKPLTFGKPSMVGLELYITKMADGANISVPGWVR